MGNMIKDLNKSKTVQKQILKEAKIKALKNTFARQIDLYYDSVKRETKEVFTEIFGGNYNMKEKINKIFEAFSKGEIDNTMFNFALNHIQYGLKKDYDYIKFSAYVENATEELNDAFLDESYDEEMILN